MSENQFEKILKYRDSYIAQNGVAPKEYITSTYKEYIELIDQTSPSLLHIIPRPQPPIKKRWFKSTFFSSDIGTEYDYHAPEYLADLERYKKEIDKMSREMSHHIFGMEILPPKEISDE